MLMTTCPRCGYSNPANSWEEDTGSQLIGMPMWTYTPFSPLFPDVFALLEIPERIGCPNCQANAKTSAGAIQEKGESQYRSGRTGLQFVRRMLRQLLQRYKR